MDVSAPHRVFGNGIAGDLLVLLGRAPGIAGQSGRQLAATLGRSHVTVTRALDGLVAQGLVRRQLVPPAHLYSLNEDHLAAPIVFQMAGLRTEFVGRLRSAIRGWDPAPAQVTLFGSAARGDGSLDSDLDILVIRQIEVDPDAPAWREQLDDLANSAESWTGNRVQYVELDTEEALAASRSDANALTGARTDGISLTDTSLSTFLRRLTRRT